MENELDSRQNLSYSFRPFFQCSIQPATLKVGSRKICLVLYGFDFQLELLIVKRITTISLRDQLMLIVIWILKPNILPASIPPNLMTPAFQQSLQSPAPQGPHSIARLVIQLAMQPFIQTVAQPAAPLPLIPKITDLPVESKLSILLESYSLESQERQSLYHIRCRYSLYALRLGSKIEYLSFRAFFF